MGRASPVDRTSDTLVVIPTLDEAASIEEAIAGVRAAGADVLVVDDGSADGTLDLVRSITSRDAAVRVLARGARLGLGSAYRDGLGWGVAAGYAVLGEMDADLSHDPADLPRLCDGLIRSGAGLAIGSRYVSGGGVVEWPRRRQVLSRGGNAYIRMLTGLPVADATAGYRLYRRDVLEAIDLQSVESEGYAFQAEMALRTWRAGFGIIEVPITFTERREGASKMSRAVIAEALWRVPVWAVRGVLGDR